jgi:hypothetical protein
MRHARTNPSATSAPPSTTAASAASTPIPVLERVDARIAALSVDPEYSLSTGAPAAEDGEPRREGVRLRAPSRIMLDGEPFVATRRFWKSLFRAANVDDGVFRLFGAEEVFARLAERESKRSLRFTIERNPAGTSRLIGVAQRASATLDPRNALTLLAGHGSEQLIYSDGVVTSRHMPMQGPGRFRIGPDDFENRFALELPLDGFGEPRLYVMVLRLVCANGALGLQRAFRSSVRLGDDPWHALDRALGSYSNPDGFSAMRRRFEASQRSWASLAEIGSLESLLHGISWGAGSGAARRRADFERLVGDLPGIYGVASINGISPKRRRLLPSRTRLYDAINFATECASHHVAPAAALRLHAWVAGLLVDEFDLEGSAGEVADFEALHLSAPSVPARAQSGARGRKS